MSNDDVDLKNIPPQVVASVQETISDWDQVVRTIGPLFDEVYGYALQNGAKLAGPTLDIWQDREMPQQDIHVEACAPIAFPIPPSKRVTGLRTAGRGGSSLHCASRFFAVMCWVEAGGYRISGPVREVYLQYAREGSPEDYVTETQYPVQKA